MKRNHMWLAMSSRPDDAYEQPWCGEPCPWVGNFPLCDDEGNLRRSAQCRRPEGHEGPHWAPGGEVWGAEDMAQVMKERKLAEDLGKIEGVNHPNHYNALGERQEDGGVRYEPIKVIESWGFMEGFCLGSALKYVLRARHKGSECQDLAKALWYLDYLAEKGGLASLGSDDEFLEPFRVAEAWELSESLTLAVEAISLGHPMEAAHYVHEELAALRKRFISEPGNDKYAGQADHEVAGWQPEDS